MIAILIVTAAVELLLVVVQRFGRRADRGAVADEERQHPIARDWRRVERRCRRAAAGARP